MAKIAIIGAGLSGATAARGLADAGHCVRLFDKGRGPGGRMSTRRIDTALGQVRLDHGAQFFTARGESFARQVKAWTDAGACAVWSGRLVRIGPDGGHSPLGGDTRYVGVGGMSSVVKAALDGLDAQFGAHVSAIEGKSGAWHLRFADEATSGPYDLVLTAVPAEQTGPLIEHWLPQMAAEANAVRSAPCWAIMAVFDQALDAPFDAARLDSGPISWMSRETSKPGRGGPEAWVLHGSPDWSQEYLEHPAADIAQTLVEALFARLNQRQTAPVSLTAHRWRYAQIQTPVGTSFGLSKDLGLGVCGDWRLGPRIEFAHASGEALAQAILA